jgi:uncharacterized radical SAM superfamily Fe-S cluster-containing enzyme
LQNGQVHDTYYSDQLISDDVEVLGQTRSICPVCYSVIDARIIKNGGKVLLVKECAEHGEFSDVYYSDFKVYDRFSRYDYEGYGLLNPNTKSERGCPLDCGLCERHKTSTLLGNIDLTNRCNLSCPICFATAEKSGYLYEPTMDQIKLMLGALRAEKPVPCFAVQFSGGEPTLRKDLPDIINLAQSMGFSYIQLATNGMVLAKDLDYCRELKKTVLATIYLQFDGVTPEPYMTTRGFNALPYKLKALENMRNTGLNNVMLVPTLVKGVNDAQVGDIINFGLKNNDIIRGVNFQPVSFTGRIDRSELQRQRLTITDFTKLVEEQTGGAITEKDFYPVPCVVPFSKILEVFRGSPQTSLTCHPHCGCATYVYYDKGEMIPITKILDVDKLLSGLDRAYMRAERSAFKKADVMVSILEMLPGIALSASKAINLDIIEILKAIVTGNVEEPLGEFHTKFFMIGAMHFQDAYNFDVNRVQRCGIHYAVPDGRVIPFCSFNILYRDELQRKFANRRDEGAK